MCSSSSVIIIAITLHVLTAPCAGVNNQRTALSGLSGSSVRLPCTTDEQRCGPIHNIQWYGGNIRVFIYSEIAGVETNENMLHQRGFFKFVKGAGISELEIRPLVPEDEGTYKCEITYLEVHEGCDQIQYINLTTIAAPGDPVISLLDGTELREHAVLGPLQEGQQLQLVCQSAGGKPAATVSWWNRTTSLPGESEAVFGRDGTGVARTSLKLTLTRYELAATLHCQASNEALELPHKVYLHLDVQVRPLSVAMTGMEGPVRSSSHVTLTCKVTGARPAANITWLLGVKQLSDLSTGIIATQTDGTTETISRLTFLTDRSMNDAYAVCLATNAVITDNGEEPMSAATKLNVHYAPVVRVAPDVVSVNQSMDVLLLCSYDANPTSISRISWFKDNSWLDVDISHYEGGSLDQPSLLVTNVSRLDSGEYRCELQNAAGASTSRNKAQLSVNFPPEVALAISPNSVLEEDGQNVTFSCQLQRGLPRQLQLVRWYLGGQLLRQLPECNGSLTGIGNGSLMGTEADLCDSDPAQILLLHVDRTFLANYSCQAANSAGWGPRSSDTEFIIKYPPGQASIRHQPETVLKGSAVSLTCELDDVGYPPANKYIWMRGNRVMTDINLRTWVISTASLEDHTVFTCMAMNKAGKSREGRLQMKINAKPEMVDWPAVGTSAVMGRDRSTSLVCRVQCSPICSLEWLQDGQSIESSRYFSVDSGILEADGRNNLFESVRSELRLNVTAFAHNSTREGSNFTCRSSSNAVGTSVNRTSLFRIHYAPRNISLSDRVLLVEEGLDPPAVRCQADALPSASYVWKYEGLSIQTGSELQLNYTDGIRRHLAGLYFCHVRNEYGSLANAVKIQVLYKPSCRIRLLDDVDRWLICEADASPRSVHFTWHLDDQHVHRHVRTDGTRSSLRVLPTSGSLGTYTCVANNSVGLGNTCRIDVAGVNISRPVMDEMDLVIVVSVSLTTGVGLLVVCVITTVVCRKRRTQRNKSCQPNLPSPAEAFPTRAARKERLKSSVEMRQKQVTNEELAAMSSLLRKVESADLGGATRSCTAPDDHTHHTRGASSAGGHQTPFSYSPSLTSEILAAHLYSSNEVEI